MELPEERARAGIPADLVRPMELPEERARAGIPADLVFYPQEGCDGSPVSLCSHTFRAITQNFLSVLCVGPHGSHANASVQGVFLT